jgi:hypothetical protein
MGGQNYLGRAAAYSMHKRYPAGSQTPAQLKAERLNLIKAREARGLYRHTNSAKYHGLRLVTAKSRGSAAAARAYKMRDIQFARNRALGIRYIQFKQKAKLKKLRITGINKKFVSRVSPSRYAGRTAWGKSKSHSFRKRLTKRSRRFHQQSKWKMRGKRFTPR